MIISSDLSSSPPTYYMPNHQPFFDWETYLRETNSESAPLKCFKQVGGKTLF